MPNAFTLLSRRLTRTLVMALLAIVLPVQGAAAGVFSAIGPAHLHQSVRAAPAAALVLEDFRRWKPAPVVQTHVFTALGHVHAGASPQRHHHAVDDASVVRTGGDGPLDGPDADGALSASAVSVLALIPGAAVWTAAEATADPATRPSWTWLTGFTQPLERPPQQG